MGDGFWCAPTPEWVLLPVLQSPTLNFACDSFCTQSMRSSWRSDSACHQRIRRRAHTDVEIYQAMADEMILHRRLELVASYWALGYTNKASPLCTATPLQHESVNDWSVTSGIGERQSG